jgi:CHAT domain-containing protein/Tfp pilus assembly protein PilF
VPNFHEQKQIRINPLTTSLFHNIFSRGEDEKIRLASAKKIAQFFFIVCWLLFTFDFFFGIESSLQIDQENLSGETGRLIESGQSLRKNGEFEQAVEMFDRALHLSRESGDQNKILYCLSSLAVLRWNMGRLKESAELFEQALRFGRANGDDDPNSRSDKALKIYDEYLKAKEARQGGRYRESIAHFKAAIDLARTIDSPEHELKCLRQVSLSYFELEELQDFYQSNTAALELAKKINHRIEEGRCLNNIGLYYSRIGRHSKALSYFEDALAFAEMTEKNGEDESVCLNNIGLVYSSLGIFDKALSFLMRALNIDKNIRDEFSICSSLNNIGELLRKRGSVTENIEDYAMALQYYTDSLALALRIKSKESEINALNNIGLVQLKLGDYFLSARYFQAALNKTVLYGVPYKLSDIYNNLGAIYSYQNKFIDSESYFQKAIEMGFKTASNDTLWEAYFGLGQCLEKEHQNNAALECYKKSSDIIDLIRSQLSLDDQRAGFARDKLKVYEALINLMFSLSRIRDETGYDAEIFRVIEKAKARGLLEDLNRGQLFSPESAFSQFQKEQESVSKRISLTISELANQGLSQVQRMRLLARLEKEEEESVSLLNKIKTKQMDKSGFGMPEIITIEKIQSQLLNPKTALLEFFLGERESYAFLITQNDFRLKNLPPRIEIENSLRAFLKLIASFPSKKNQCRLAAKRIYEELIYPFEDNLISMEHLIIVPDGILNYLPFETLIENHEGTRSNSGFLIENYKISYAPSSSSLSYLIGRPSENKRSKRLLAFGNPVYLSGPHRKHGKSVEEALREAYLNSGFDFSSLPHSRSEILEICRCFDETEVDYYLNEKAKEEVVKTAPLNDYQIVHFACHGFHDEEIPLRSALVLTLDDSVEEDGFLQGREIYGLSLNADLVVLSACQTGKGRLDNAEGVLGLPRVFFNAGARSVVSSLWKVNDRSTSELMRYFYRYLSDGNDKAQSLRLAKLKMLKSKYSHPFFWAGFILHGDFHQISKF